MVTGATGYLGSWVVKGLLEKGYTVRLAVRNKDDEARFRYLTEMAQRSSGKLEMWSADLLQAGSFDKIAAGCRAIIHMASPFTLRFKDPQKELVDPALQGTRNVLGAASASATVEKVILTSSVAAVHGDNIDMTELKLGAFNEVQFNYSSSLKHQPYSYSKVVAEKEAWKIEATQKQWHLVVINPAFVMGPPLSQASHSESLALMKDLLTGKYRAGAPDLMFGFVDVRDVARAHILGMEDEQASGRYILAERVVSLYDFSQMIKTIYGRQFKLPLMKAPKFMVSLMAPLFGLTRKFVRRNVGYVIRLDSSRSRDNLHLTYTPLEKTIRDMIERMRELAMI